MPTLSRFYGIIIRMYYQQAEHNPPHVHAFYGGNIAAVEIQTGAVLDGELPPKVLALVRKWIDLHQAELLDIWDTQKFMAIPPLM